jgi:hypothetical protein
VEPVCRSVAAECGHAKRKDEGIVPVGFGFEQALPVVVREPVLEVGDVFLKRAVLGDDSASLVARVAGACLGGRCECHYRWRLEESWSELRCRLFRIQELEERNRKDDVFVFMGIDKAFTCEFSW